MRLLLVVISCISLSALPAEAATIARYDAGTAGNPAIPPDPQSSSGGDWTLIPGNAGQSSGPVSDDAGLGLNAWNITDNSAASGSRAYIKDISQAEIASALSQGWRLDGRLRMVDDFDTDLSQFLFFDDGSKRWSVLFDLDANEDLVATLQQDGGDVSFTVTSGGTGSAAYHEYALVYDPATMNADFFVDGSLQTASYTGLATVNIFEAVYFGAGSSSERGSANYNLVQFQIVPEPATFILLFLGFVAAPFVATRTGR